MKFPHLDPEFDALVRIVAEKEGLSVGLIEKDYWVTHTLWALHDAGFAIWFKGGTSLSKGFGLIQRFSENLDLRIDPGSVEGLILPDPWDGRSKAAVRGRTEYFEALTSRFNIPNVEVRPPNLERKYARFASYEAVYPGGHQDEVEAKGMLPFVLIEAGRARVTPFVERDMSSLVHDHLERLGRTEMLANLPKGVRCLNPRVTLMDKLDAISGRYGRGAEAAKFARHYEDAAQIIRVYDRLPAMDGTPKELADEMLQCKDIPAIPSYEDAAFSPSGEQLEGLERAWGEIEGMFWGARIPLDECCSIIREWLRQSFSQLGR